MKPLTSESSHLSATGGVAGNTRPRVSGSTYLVGRRSRPGRIARCCRSSVAAPSKWAPVRVGCSVFLNNRYYDPATGIFISVDPLVATTGTAYLYANGNPTTLSDPNGLEPGCGATARGTSCSAAHAATSLAWGNTPTGLSSNLSKATGDPAVNDWAVNGWLATCMYAYAECTAPGVDPSRFLPGGLKADPGHIANFNVAVLILRLYAMSQSAHFDPALDAVVSSVGGYDFLPTYRMGDGVWGVQAMQRSTTIVEDLTDPLVWLYHHPGLVFTAGAIGTCLVASFGACAVASGTALVVRSAETLSSSGWGDGDAWRSIGVDAFITTASLGMASAPAYVAEKEAIQLLTVTGQSASLGASVAIYRVAGSLADIAGFVGGIAAR